MVPCEQSLWSARYRNVHILIVHIPNGEPKVTAVPRVSVTFRWDRYRWKINDSGR